MVNCPVIDLSGRLLGVADLLDPVAGLVVEFDGADHRSARRHSSDVDREAGFRGVGLEVARVTGPDLLSPPLVVARLHAARAHARFEGPGTRRWFPKPPADVLDEFLERRDLEASLLSGRGTTPQATIWEGAVN